MVICVQSTWANGSSATSSRDSSAKKNRHTRGACAAHHHHRGLSACSLLYHHHHHPTRLKSHHLQRPVRPRAPMPLALALAPSSSSRAICSLHSRRTAPSDSASLTRHSPIRIPTRSSPQVWWLLHSL